MTKFTFDPNSISDLHKDALGMRPGQDFWADWALADDIEKQEIWDSLLKMLQYSMD